MTNLENQKESNYSPSHLLLTHDMYFTKMSHESNETWYDFFGKYFSKVTNQKREFYHESEIPSDIFEEFMATMENYRLYISRYSYKDISNKGFVKVCLTSTTISLLINYYQNRNNG